MNRIITLCTLFCIVLFNTLVNAQNNVGIGTTTPNSSAVLDITATGKGLLIPRMTLANRPASPATGLIIYQTDNTPGFYYYNGTSWVMLSSGSLSGSGTISQIPFFTNSNTISGSNNFLWDNTGNKITINGLNDGTPAAGFSNWISGNFGGSGGNRVVMGVQNGEATIGGHNNTLTGWADLVLQPANQGNIGIGKNSPTVKLDVEGDIKSSATVTANNVVTTNITANNVSSNKVITGTNLTPLSANAALEINTTTGALLLSRLSTTERDALANPINGMIIHNITTNTLDIYSLGRWRSILFNDQSANPTESLTFNYTGTVQTFTVPDGVTSLQVELNGAQGGVANTNSTPPYTPASGGLGGKVTATLTVTPGQVLHLYVGGSPGASFNGGFNGGGNAGVSNYNFGRYYAGGGGGGATDIRIGGNNLTDRVIVAGGGGGSSWNSNGGGLGGGLTGGTSDNVATGGSQTAGGNNGGSLGIGASCVGFGSNGSGVGGGGAGYYGGGTNCITSPNATAGGGGGGSSFTDPTLCNNVVHTQGIVSGNGSIIITYQTARQSPYLDGSNFSNIALSALPNTITAQGNSFNGNNQLVQLNASGELPAINATNLTNINATNIASGTLSDNRLSSNVTLQGNNFNGNNQLVQLNNSGQLPAIDASQLSNINATNVTSGTLTTNYGGTGTNSTFTQGSIVFVGNSGVYNQNNNKLFWNNTNHQLGVGTTGTNATITANSTNTGSGYTDWITINAGAQTGDRLVGGLLNGTAAIGAHNNNLTDWSNLVINPSSTHSVHVGAEPNTNPIVYNSSLTGNINRNLVVNGSIRQGYYGTSVSVNANTAITITWTHNLGYNPIVMNSLDQTLGSNMSYCTVTTQHIDNNTTQFIIRNLGSNNATGALRWILVW
jgi:hypothetical protein